MRRALIRLYPAAWRTRYGAELEALMLDVPAGWRGDLDVFKGALGMRLKYQSGRGIVLGFVVAGILAGWLVGRSMPDVWRATATMQITPARIPESGGMDAVAQAVIAKVQQVQSNVTSRRSLAALINDPRFDLYREERRTEPLEDIEDTMRSGIVIRLSSDTRRAGRIFTIAFTYPDRGKAKDVVNALINRFVQEFADEAIATRDGRYFLDTLDPPFVPSHPFAPKRANIMVAGGIIGLILAFATLLIRRRMQPPDPASNPHETPAEALSGQVARPVRR